MSTCITCHQPESDMVHDPMVEAVGDPEAHYFIPDFSTYIVDHTAVEPQIQHNPLLCDYRECYCPCSNCQSYTHQRSRGIR